MKSGKKVCVERLVRDAAQLEKSIQLNDFTRLYPTASVAFAESAAAEVSLAFGRDANERSVIIGKVRANLVVECSRCLHDLDELLDFSFTVYPVTYYKLKTLPDGCEPVIVDEEGYLDLIELVEDEIILALPDRVLHKDIKVCEANLNVKFNNQGIIYGCSEVEKISC